MNRRTWTALAIVGAIGLGAVAFVAAGGYDVSATSQHTQPVYDVMRLVMQQSVRRRAADVAVPPLADAVLVERGAACYRDRCVQCHGAPGVAQHDIGRSMQPLPGPLVDAARHWSPGELYWITRHGIKMTGMPAWQHRLAEADLWALVAFMQKLPALSAPGYAALQAEVAADTCRADPQPPATRPGDAVRGRQALHQHACNACHVIPGVVGAPVHVGPPLQALARRTTIAGVLPNTTEHLVRWIREPHAVDPDNAMPDLAVDEQAARDMAAYLATLH